MNQTLSKNPAWWTDKNETAWNRVKQAMKRDWDQTKHDFGGNEPDTNQEIGNTMRQARGQETIPPRGLPAHEEYEPAHRFGYGARSRYAEEYPEWDEELEARLRADWEASSAGSDWKKNRNAVRFGWDFEK